MTFGRSTENISRRGQTDGLAPVDSASDLQHAELAALYDLWLEKAVCQDVPSRDSIDATELKRWLPHLQLLDIVRDGADIRYRVIGTWIVDRYGQDDTGKTMAEIGLTHLLQEVLTEFLTAARTMRAHRVVRPFYDRDGIKEHTRAERLLLPLSADGAICNKVLSGIYYLSRERRTLDRS